VSDQRPASPLAARLSAHAASRNALLIAGLWGLAEATLFFLVPDIYIGLVALFNWRRGLWATAFTVLGALVGGAVMYALAANNPPGMQALLTYVPLVSRDMVNTVGEQLRTQGLAALVTGPLQGIPYKVYAVQAGAQRLPFAAFWLLTIPARLERILPVALIGAAAGTLLRSFIQRHTKWVVAAYAAFWLVVYALYFVRLR
jgi:membrane protein DedA with SNARE-associated domain